MRKFIVFLLVVVGLALLPLLYAMFFRENLIISKREAKERFRTPASHFITWHGAEIHYTDEGEGHPMLMIHGFGGNFTNFDSLAAIFKADHRVIRVDLPGFGLSDLPSVHDSISVLYRNFFADFFDTLALDSLYVVGNSLGGWMGWELAAENPDKVKGLVLLGSAGYEIEKVKANIGRIDLLQHPIFMKLLERGMPLWMSTQNAERMRSEWETFKPEEVLKNNGIANREGNLQNLIKLGNSGVLPDTSKIKQVQCPTLIVFGRQDVIVPWHHAQKFNRDIANSVALVYDTCGHIPQMEYPHRVANDIRKFVTGYQ